MTDFIHNFLGCVLNFCVHHFVAISIVTIIVTSFWLVMRKPHGIPPGPSWTLPIVGDMLSIGSKTDKSNVTLPFRRLRKKYGDIYSVYTGPKLTIVVSGIDNIKELLIKNGDVFSDRPPTYLNDYLSKRKGLVSTSGFHWKEQRKFAVDTLREFGFGKPILEGKIHAELEILVNEIGKHRGEKFNFFNLIQYSVANIIASIVFGKRFEYDDPAFNGFIDRMNDTSASFSGAFLVNVLPILRFLPGDVFSVNKIHSNMEKNRETLFEPAIEEHKKHFNQYDTDDFISSYIKEMKRKTGQKSTFDGEQLIFCTNDLFLAGTETTSTTILWAIVYFLHYPEVLGKCYQEIQDVVGSGRLPSMKDKPNMPYLEAVTTELLRICNIAILNLPRAPAHDVTFQGYNIPHDAIIIPNLDSVLSDDSVWGDAGTFRPERFLDENGKFVKHEQFLAFSIGKRNCLGESMAKMELFLFLSTLIQRFDFKPVKGNNLPGFTGTFGVTHIPKKFKVHAIPR
ncbi:hypothetical protein LOTGIDRAFT_217014 [Lottia gigantea]|uniref:Uncharacterized protein n=1 Tax=Lottia gigantea TaxID=225164 RepID=V4A602_LOTGI|nr:hypothetical protein LOTGIDRAFT_217014 [Lottia gigantea]ESO92157.1 hypothetical protein LOTGIDRAFT_217014 [Lottia gigantea]